MEDTTPEYFATYMDCIRENLNQIEKVKKAKYGNINI